MLRAETSIIEGGGFQTGIGRWGDYASMAIDASDDRTFVYTNEYYAQPGGNGMATGWSTRMATAWPPAAEMRSAVSSMVSDRLPLTDVADEVGLCPATLLQRFGSKRELLRALTAQAASQLEARVNC